MSKPHRSGSFSDLGKGLQPKTELTSTKTEEVAAERLTAAIVSPPLEHPAPPTAQESPNDQTTESFSTKLSRGTKRRLKVASGYENRTVIQILEQAIGEYMKANHPNLE